MDDLNISVENLSDHFQETTRVMICQLDIRKFKFGRDRYHLYRIEDSDVLRQHIDRLLNIASINNVDMIVFPEFSIPACMVEYLYKFAHNHNLYIIAGTDYYTKGESFVSRCPVITPQHVYYVEKYNTSVLERTPIQIGRTLKGGDTNIIFQHTRFGSFAVAVCADFMDDGLKYELTKKCLSMLIVPAYHGKSTDYHQRMDINVRDSRQGLYIAYSNIKDDKPDSGKSGLFALVHRDFLAAYKDDGCTDCIPETKIYQFKDSSEYAIFELDMTQRKPFIAKNNSTDFNVKIISEDNQSSSNSAQLSQYLGISGLHYMLSDSLYVAPKEFDDISRILSEKNVVVILGDPGTGKTYTAFKLLSDYYAKGYKPLWIHGISKEDRATLNFNLAEYTPKENEIIYVEDPFGHTTFDKREEIVAFIGPLVESIRKLNSKLIITSRIDVFDTFNKQHETSFDWTDIIEDINIAKPSYDKESLVKIATNYFSNIKCVKPEVSKFIVTLIEDGKLSTPLSICDTIATLSESSDLVTIQNLVTRKGRLNILDSIAEEYSQQTIPDNLLYSMVLLAGNENRTFLSDVHKNVQTRLFMKRLRIQYLPFNTLLTNALKYRVQTIGMLQPVLRFRHPLYEQAFCHAILQDDKVQTVLFELIDYLFEIGEDTFLLVLSFLNRLRFLHASVAERVGLHICECFPDNLTINQRVLLTRKLRALNSSEVDSKLVSVLTPDVLLKYCYSDCKTDLSETIRLVRFYIDRGYIQLYSIDWKAIFSEEYLFSEPVNNIVNCMNMANCLKPYVSTIIFDGIPSQVIYRMLLGTRNEDVFKRICVLLKGTNHTQLIDEIRVYKQNLNSKRKLSLYHQFLVDKYLVTEDIKGAIIVDRVALEKVYFSRASLYGVGVVSFQGKFNAQDPILITDMTRKESVLAFAAIDSDTLYNYLQKPVRSSLKLTRGGLCKRVKLCLSRVKEIVESLPLPPQ